MLQYYCHISSVKYLQRRDLVPAGKTGYPVRSPGLLRWDPAYTVALLGGCMFSSAAPKSEIGYYGAYIYGYPTGFPLDFDPILTDDFIAPPSFIGVDPARN